jgi:hypothetical protein
VYMPLVYGKTQHSARGDILKALDFTLTKGDARMLYTDSGRLDSLL